ncbi:coumaroyl-CoA:anthocyanidin 3-O-glucoside-6''-O-coumaroyltransferase 1 [Cajanus cajan]|uniref:coumaroyl-CoA:anthocyanidin 3-O-glucoside-6''-O-coumaroyltransferase 1 n=1 Tax=Cajanus cajan TaxID=3821 RepID=UPI00098D987E|nr:coumaroyl-CoA:anthocyanidin 3-O-glucoside-6''-O-coumaroyltransferase 1 [Cajanus cajan]
MSITPFTMKVLEQCSITPPPTTAPLSSLLPLTFFDIPWLFFSPSQPLFFYEFPHSTSHFTATVLPKLKQSLSLTLQHYYPFAATFTPSSDLTKPHLICTDHMSVAFTITESNGDFKHFCNNHPRDAKDFHLLLPKLASSFPHQGKEHFFPLLAIQVTLFPNAGVCIGFAFHHVVADGRTFHNFFKTWASYCCSFGSASAFFPPESLPLRDPSVIIDAKGLEEVFLKEWRKRRLVQDIAIGREPKLVDLSVNNHEDHSYFGFIAGGITRLDYPVPITYLGNCVGFGRASVRRKELLGEDGIVIAAKSIGSTIKKLDASIFAGAEKWISDWEVLHGSEQHVHATWSPKLKLYELDFGWGRPKKIEEISIDYTGAVSLLQSRDVVGGIEIGLALPKSKMDIFSMLFTKGLVTLP